ncbi:hypothetical protein D9M68_1000730 [compost metagenome]
MLEQRGLDLGKQVAVAARVAEVDAADLGTNGGGQLTDVHGSLLGVRAVRQITKMEEPVVLRASRSRWAWTASSSA